MRDAIKVALFIGVGVICILSTVAFFKISKINDQAEVAINQSLQDANLGGLVEAVINQSLQDTNLGELGMRVEFAPFECGGFLKIECKSPKLEVWRGELPLFSLTNPILSIGDFDLNSVVLNFDSGFDYLQHRDLKEYFDVLLPKKINFSSRFELSENKEILTQSTLDLKAKNLDYRIDFSGKMTSPSSPGDNLKKFLIAINNKSIFLKTANLELKSKELDRALFELAKKQYGKLSLMEYQGLVVMASGVSMSQVSYSPSLQALIQGVTELALGRKTELKASFQAKKEICLTCNVLLPQDLFRESEIRVETF